MGLFDQIMSAINNPSQEGSPNQLQNILGTVQQLGSQYGLDPGTAQTVLSTVGTYVRSALQERRETAGFEQAQAIVSQFSGMLPNYQAVAALLPPEMQARLVQEINQRTGLNVESIQEMLPMLVPVVLNFLKMGGNAQNTQQSGNPVLSSFLDADGDGDVDIADAMQLGNRFFNRSGS
ncbi:DUF937 domain-containing protein [Kamptonema formosum]|uniref:DUF937 domain-containing protein n=1 Tax=Kamptonema formosum TaxID=331992 RepID=UPI00034D22C7|nr:DUF937 domain-containing protein [Oscillatoria sp. PCC 10802]